MLEVRFSDHSTLRHVATDCCAEETLTLATPIDEREAAAVLIDAWALGDVRAELGDVEPARDLIEARRAKPPTFVTAIDEAGRVRGFELPNWTLAYLVGAGGVSQLRTRAVDGDIRFGW